MISIIQHIQYLITRHDCVVVPGLGAFVARNIGASFAPDGRTMTPPSRELGFNGCITHDDGLLTGSVTRREGVSYECARNAVEQEVELIQRRLRNEGTLTLSRIGTFTLTAHGAIEFTPDTVNPVASLPYCGLGELTLNSLDAPVLESEPVILTQEEAVRHAKRRNPVIGVMKYAASAAVLVGVCLTMLTPISPANVDLASLKPSVISAPAAELDNFMPDESKYAGRTLPLAAPDPEEATATVEPRYYVIVASAASMNEARKYVKYHSTEATPLRILPGEGRYRVYAAAGNDFEAMSAFRTADPEFAAANPNAWVYTRK